MVVYEKLHILFESIKDHLFNEGGTSYSCGMQDLNGPFEVIMYYRPREKGHFVKELEGKDEEEEIIRH